MKFRIVHLWVISFLVVLPLLAQKWVYSPLFLSTKHFRARAFDLVDELNIQRYGFGVHLDFDDKKKILPQGT